MGTWGHSAFDNDAAGDFAEKIARSNGLGLIVSAFHNIPEEENEYVEYEDAVRAIVAGEVVAVAKGDGGDDLPDALLDWAKNLDAPGRDLVREARRAIVRVMEDSELRELWRDSPNRVDWEESVENLLARLRA